MKRLVHVIQLAICFAGVLATSLFAQSSGGGSSSSGSSTGTGTGTTGTSGSTTGTASGSTGTSKKDEDASATEPQTRGMKEAAFLFGERLVAKRQLAASKAKDC
jgi:hypothetical protein